MTSTVKDHCRRFALSDPNDKSFQSPCFHKHTENCEQCDSLDNVVDEIKKAVVRLGESRACDSSLVELKEELLFIVEKSKQDITSWKAHLLRSVNQDEARVDIIDKLDETSVLLVQDWAMKFLPRKYRESQRDWFSKRGISWHVTVAIRKDPDGQIQMLTFVNVFESCSQDSCTVVAVMSNVLQRLKEIIPALKSVYYWQDNAGCYHCGSTIVVAELCGRRFGLKVKRMDFADPQGGKGACDRKAATIKSHMKIFHDEGNNIESASDMKAAILSSGGVPAVNVVVSGPPDDSEFPKVEIKGVSFYTNVEYTRGGFKVWKAYNIGKGKVIPRNKFSITSLSVPQLTNLDVGSQESQSEFLTVKSKKKGEEEENNFHSESPPVSTEDIVDDQNESHLFSCPEPGCIKRYQRFSSLQRHLDCGNHKRELEKETLFDRAAVGYAERLDKQSGCVPILQASQNANSPREHVLSMGWALKSAQTKRTRFNEKQKNYMTTKFNIGETTGFKANPADVAKAMMTTRDDNGDRMFTIEEFLTTQQVSSFFSRLASKKTLPNDNVQDDDDALAAENETDLQDLQELVVQEVSLQHPIIYDRHNMCELISNSKMKRFAVPMLRQMCIHFDIDINDIKANLKQPYIDKLTFFVRQCSCAM